MENQQKELRNSDSSINSNPELKHNKIFYLRISLIVINIISAILGLYIYKYKNYYLNPEYNFDYYKCLIIFLIIYSLGMILSLLFAFLLAILIKICNFILNLFSNNNNNNQLMQNSERPATENSIRYINANSDDIAIIPYTMTWFVVLSAILYFFSLPYSIFLLIFMQKDKTYSILRNFQALYSFLVINLLAGLILFYVILIVVFVKREGSFRKKKLSIDDQNLQNLREEIKEAMQKAK